MEQLETKLQLLWPKVYRASIGPSPLRLCVRPRACSVPSRPGGFAIVDVSASVSGGAFQEQEGSSTSGCDSAPSTRGKGP